MTPAFGAQAALAVALAAPVVMIPARVVPPTLLVIVAVLLGLATWRGGRFAATLAVLREGIGRPLVLALLALLGLSALSLVWTPAPGRGGAFLSHMIGTSALLAFCLAAIVVERPALHRLAPAFILVIASIALVLDLATGGGVRALFGTAAEPFRLNRAAVAIVLLLPLATALLVRGARRWAIVPVWALGVWAAFASDSETAKLALPLTAVVFAFAVPRPVLGIRTVTTAAIAATLAIPLAAPYATDLIPAGIRSDPDLVGVIIRADIWAAYAALIAERPFPGYGIEAGHVAAILPETLGFTPERRALLDWGHPHNGPLQIWFELGAIGVVLACLLLWRLGRAIERHAGDLLPAATATFAAAYAVFFVSHGAWQAWWWALLALVAILFVAAARRDGP